jgi:hypothetical protein
MAQEAYDACGPEPTGTHPLAGHYYSKADFLTHTFEKLDNVLPQGAELYVAHALVSDD